MDCIQQTDTLYAEGISVATLQKPEKIYLDNTNLAFALSGDKPDKGNLRETFFFNQLSHAHSVRQSKAADFLVDGIYTFEVGGKNKSRKQVEDLPDAYVVKDDIESGLGQTVPLWAFGFLYRMRKRRHCSLVFVNRTRCSGRKLPPNRAKLSETLFVGQSAS